MKFVPEVFDGRVVHRIAIPMAKLGVRSEIHDPCKDQNCQVAIIVKRAIGCYQRNGAIIDPRVSRNEKPLAANEGSPDVYCKRHRIRQVPLKWAWFHLGHIPIRAKAQKQDFTMPLHEPFHFRECKRLAQPYCKFHRVS